MALDQVVKNAAAGVSANNQLQQQIGAAVMYYLYPQLAAIASQIETQALDPTVNTTLGDAIHGVVSGAAKYGLNPQQWYNQLVTTYSQPMFGYGLGNGNLAYAAYLFAAWYVALSKSKNRNAQIYKDIVGNVLTEILYHYYLSIGKNPSKQVIRSNIDWFANGLNGGHTGALNLAYSTTILRTWDPLFAQSSFTLISTLDNIIMNTMQSLMDTIYSKVQIPQVVTLILNRLVQNGLYNNMFNYINRRINDYIRQALQQPSQQAGQQPTPQPGGQQGQQGNLPNVQQPPQPPAGQQQAPQQQQNQQNQSAQVPQPYRITPQNRQ